MTRIEHLPSCDSARLERVEHVAPRARRATVIRCQSCGAQLVLVEPEQRLDPSSEEFAELWELDPARLAHSLTPAERLDPNLNPLHPAAGWPPARTTVLPSRVVIDPWLAQQIRRKS